MAETFWERLNRVQSENVELRYELEAERAKAKYRRARSAVQAMMRAAAEYRYHEEREERLKAQFRPLGDNHHNAMLCPYCNPSRIDPVAVKKNADRLVEALEQIVSEYDIFGNSAAHDMYEIASNAIEDWRKANGR